MSLPTRLATHARQRAARNPENQTEQQLYAELETVLAALEEWRGARRAHSQHHALNRLRRAEKRLFELEEER